eukprot:6127466-Pleurochrysis_carterae.AAC.1
MVGGESPLENSLGGGRFARSRRFRARLIGGGSKVTRQRDITTLRWPFTDCESPRKSLYSSSERVKNRR